jgi:hypothetical protein
VIDAFPHECVMWPGRVDRDGYGIAASGGHKRAHRLMYALFVGPIPTGLCVLHSCDVPTCVNPRHLRIGTQIDNVDDRSARGRQPLGTKSPHAKLSVDQVSQIRSGLGLHEAIALFGIKKSSYYRVRSGSSYQDVAQ